MDESKALTWAILKNDFTVLADHLSLARITELVGGYCSQQAGPVCNRVCGDVIARIMATQHRPEVLCKVVHEWLNTYQLPLDMDQHRVWSAFHDRCSPWIYDHMGQPINEHLPEFG
jgi:hypothetical protein